MMIEKMKFLIDKIVRDELRLLAVAVPLPPRRVLRENIYRPLANTSTCVCERDENVC